MISFIPLTRVYVSKGAPLNHTDLNIFFLGVGHLMCAYVLIFFLFFLSFFLFADLFLLVYFFFFPLSYNTMSIIPVLIIVSYFKMFIASGI